MLWKAATVKRVIGDSQPPATAAVTRPARIISKASPIALFELAQAVTVQMFGPRMPK